MRPGIAPAALGTAPLSSAGQKPQPRAQREVSRDQHPLTASSAKLHPGRVRPSGIHALLCCLLVAYRQDTTRLSCQAWGPESSSCSLADQHLPTRAAERCVIFSPGKRRLILTRVLAAKRCLTDWQGQNTEFFSTPSVPSQKIGPTAAGTSS